MRTYTAEWSARTRGPRWRTVVGKAPSIRASSLPAAVREAVRQAETGGKLAAIRLHVIEVGVDPKPSKFPDKPASLKDHLDAGILPPPRPRDLGAVDLLDLADSLRRPK